MSRQLGRRRLIRGILSKHAGLRTSGEKDDLGIFPLPDVFTSPEETARDKLLHRWIELLTE
jgi:hypothetical protein